MHRAEQPFGWMRPARQGFIAAHAAVAEGDDRLVIHRQIAGPQRGAKIGLEPKRMQRLGVHRGVEDLDRSGLALACLVKRVVGVA